MSTTGRLNNLQPYQNKGFTLIELVVVLSLIGIMLVVSVPRFQEAFHFDNTEKVSRWIIGKSQFLKEQSVRDQELYALHLDLDADRLWITSESMSEEEKQDARHQGFGLSGDVNLLDVAYPDKEKATTGQADIYFYKQGYSDRAMIHIKDDENKQRSFLIEAFLAAVKLYEGYVEFEDRQ